MVKINEGDIDEKFVVFPNPVTNKRIIYFYVNSQEVTEQAVLSFYDLKGSFVKSKELKIYNNSSPLEVDVSFLRPGSYIINYFQGELKKKSKLIVL